MNDTEVLLSQLAADQLADLSPSVGQSVVDALTRLISFPESGSPLRLSGYGGYRQVVVKNHRAVYRYLPEGGEVRVYCILHTRRHFPPLSLLSDELF